MQQNQLRHRPTTHRHASARVSPQIPRLERLRLRSRARHPNPARRALVQRRSVDRWIHRARARHVCLHRRPLPMQPQQAHASAWFGKRQWHKDARQAEGGEDCGWRGRLRRQGVAMGSPRRWYVIFTRTH